MTTLIAWVGVDSRGPTSLYFASDSRISWDRQPSIWDCGQKLFASSVGSEIFGFTGYVLLPQSILSKACTLIDRKLRSSSDEASIDGRVDWLNRLVKREVDQHPNWRNEDFTIFYGARIGYGMPGRATFHLHMIAWDSKSSTLKEAPVPIPDHSAVLRTSGSGKPRLDIISNAWERSGQGNTSRTMFSAFCDTVKLGDDPMSGGEPQLVGLYREGPANIFGVVTENGASYQGQLGTALPATANIEWRDPLFQRVDAQGRLLKKAQRHGRPTLS